MPDDEHEGLSRLVGEPQRLGGQRRADAAVLTARRDAEGAQLQRVVIAQLHPAQHHVADDPPVLLVDERDRRPRLARDSNGPLLSVERRRGQRDDRLLVVRPRGSDQRP
jgi:hypothetical protein